MVRIVQRHQRESSSAFATIRQQQRLVCCVLFLIALGTIVMSLVSLFPSEAAIWERRVQKDIQSLEKRAQKDIETWEKASARKVGGPDPEGSSSLTDDDELRKKQCPYESLSDLSSAERYPVASKLRHMVTPPADGDAGVTLVCCETTAGPWSILVHSSWAPIGAKRFLDMVEAKYFDATVPLMRCINGFLCQFGLNGNPDMMKPFKDSIPDDPNWLPEGKDHRHNELGVRRFQKGYMAYAGSGTASRGIQLIVALEDNGPLAGGSPWEVPWGEVVGTHSFETLSRIYTGYGEKGPSQALLSKADALTFVKENYPEIDYVNSCRVVDRG